MQKEQQIQAILDVSNIGIVVLDKNEVVITCNEVAAKAINSTVDELIGTIADEKAIDVITEDGKVIKREDYPHYKTLRTGTPTRNFLYGLVRKDNPEKVAWKLMNTQPIFGDNNTPEGVAFAFYDITSLKEHEKQQVKIEKHIQQLNKLQSLNVMAGGIAHDFNNLLMTIQGNAEIAMDNAGNDRLLLDYLSQIMAASKKAARLTGQMLAYAGKSSIEINEININDLLEGILQQARRSLPQHIWIDISCDVNLPLIKSDVSQITQVIVDLVNNAAESIGDKPGTITIRTAVRNIGPGELTNRITHEPLAGGDYIILSVGDTGHGIDTDTLSRIFEPFYSTKFLGRGLGLAAVEGIVRSNNGTIIVNSKPQQGTRFDVYLPAHPPQPQKIPETPARTVTKSDNKSHVKTILVVDDEHLILKLAEAMLKRLNYKIVTANHGLEAVEIIRGSQIKVDAIIMDMLMPVMNGEEAIREIKTIDDSIPIVISSGYSEIEIKTRCGNTPIDGFLQKPFSMKKLQHVIHSCFDQDPQSPTMA